MYKTIDEIPAHLRWLAENEEWNPPKFISDGVALMYAEEPPYPAARYCQVGSITSKAKAGECYTYEQHQAARELISGKPGWDEAPEWAQWLAQDADGEWWWFQRKPVAGFDVDTDWGNEIGNDALANGGKAISDWRDTLEHRPESVETSAGSRTIDLSREPWSDEYIGNELLDGDAPEEGEEREETLADLYPKYYKDVTGLHSIDVYMTHELFGIDDPSGCIQHASKKLLLSGVRTGGKSKVDDIREARDTLTRWLEINE